MDMTEAQRRDLAERVRLKRLEDYGGNRRRAYTDVDVNPATWTKAEEAVEMAERSYVAIIRGLWPETHGDWRRMDPPLGEGLLTDEERVAQLGLSPEGAAEVLAILARDRERKQREEGTA